MSRQLEQGMEQARDKRNRRVVAAVENGLLDSVGRAGGILCGLSMRIAPEDVLMTIRADFPGGRQIAFVGGSDMGSVLIKASREARMDKLTWREDKYAKKST